jgi:hypothetical protein
LKSVERLLAFDVPQVAIAGFEPGSSHAPGRRRSRADGRARSVRYGANQYPRRARRRSKARKLARSAQPARA